MQIRGTRFPIWLVLMYILALGAILAWPCVAFGSAFMFDAPMTAAQTQSTEMGVVAVLAYPIMPIGGVLGSFLAWRAGRKRLGVGLAVFALVPAVAFILIVASSYAMSALYALGVKF